MSYTVISGGNAQQQQPPRQSRRSSLMSALRRKKTDGAKIARPELSESAARRDTKLERSAEQLSAIRRHNASPRLQKARRGDSWPLPEPELGPELEPGPELEHGPELATTEPERETGLEHEFDREPAAETVLEPGRVDDIYEGPDAAAAAEEEREEKNDHLPPLRPPPQQDDRTLGLLKRPATSGSLKGVSGAGSSGVVEGLSVKPGFMKRRSTSTGLLGFGGKATQQDVQADEQGVDGEVKRKKKFGVLRRMFGIND
jgi:hypothetical protein